MEESFDTFEEEKYFLKESLEEGQINKKTHDRMVRILNKKNRELKKNWKEYTLWHSLGMKLLLGLLGFIIIAALFIRCVSIWTGAYGDALLRSY